MQEKQLDHCTFIAAPCGDPGSPNLKSVGCSALLLVKQQAAEGLKELFSLLIDFNASGCKIKQSGVDGGACALT
jgi:hypothetical protein